MKLGFLFTLVAVIVSLSLYYFGPEKDLQFNALESLIYEGIALDESPETRLDFATNSISEVNSYLRQSLISITAYLILSLFQTDGS